ncbi:MAG TPA: ribulose-phosphate 3-epimerase, partial [Polyangiaceae bacterium]|nr:ribulose-phosphate 3-epimerase [Polyangiaceae bacterium]
VLVMSVNPGFGGQSFLASQLPKVRALRRAIDARGLETHLEIDGGISPSTAGDAAGAGARVMVAGSAIFAANKSRDASLDERIASYQSAIAAIRKAAG